MTARLAHRTRGGFRGLMIAAVTAALLLGARGKTADAAPPTLSASENPVVIAAPASTKAITLAYNLNGSLAKALLTVDEVGGPTLLSTAVGAAPGSVPLTVTYGKSYKAQLVDASTKSPVATLQFTTKRPDPNNPGGQELITSSNIIPHGTYTEVAMMANQPAMFAVTASTDKPDAGGNFAHIDSSAITFVPQTSWTGMLPNLKPNTTYYYAITAKNIGYTSGTYEQSTFKTRTRRVDVLFETLHVTDDSDPFGFCECIFLFKAGAEPAQDYPDDTINDGWTVTPN